MEDDNDSSIEEKQEFLRESVLEKGLDANSFADYLVSKKGEEGSNLDTWSMSELKLAVKEFIEINDSKKKESEKEKEDDENEKIIIENEDKIENDIDEKEIKIKEKDIPEKEKDIQEKEKSSKKEKKESEKEKGKEKEIKIQNTKIENIFPPEIYGILCPPTFECKKLENTPLSSIENLIITISSP